MPATILIARPDVEESLVIDLLNALQPDDSRTLSVKLPRVAR
jgi:hypothetical protein